MPKIVLSTFILVVMFIAGLNTACAQSADENIGERPEDEDTQDLTTQSKPGEALPALTGTMTPKRLGEIILKIDENAEVGANSYTFTLADRQLFLVYDTNADRMRIISPIFPAANLPEDVETRLLQANYDAVLDARYAIAQDLVWSVFLHRLSSLQEDDFLSGMAQVVTAAETFGTTYTSGAMVFGGGDSNTIHEDLLDKLKELQKSADGEEDI